MSPTPEQAESFAQVSGVVRLVYNLAWEQRRDFWRQFKRQTGRNICFPSQSRELTELRSQHDWIAAVARGCLESALRDLDRAFVTFFKGSAKYPTPRCRGVNDSFRFGLTFVRTRKLNAKWSEIRVPNIGWVKFRDTRPLNGRAKNATISKDGIGWHISFGCKVEHTATENRLPSVGIDRGVANTLALSTGEMLSLPDISVLDRRKRKAQRALARKRRGSVRYSKARRRASRLSAKIARVRRDWQHKATISIAERFGTVVLEDLRITSMTASAVGTAAEPGKNVRQKAGLNRSILNQGWATIERLLAYKLEERGGALVKINPAYTSQTCSGCGIIDKGSRESQASFNCKHCGFSAHADTNAAINILRGNTALMRTEGHQLRSGEVRTTPNRVAEAA